MIWRVRIAVLGDGCGSPHFDQRIFATSAEQALNKAVAKLDLVNNPAAVAQLVAAEAELVASAPVFGQLRLPISALDEAFASLGAPVAAKYYGAKLALETVEKAAQARRQEDLLRAQERQEDQRLAALAATPLIVTPRQRRSELSR